MMYSLFRCRDYVEINTGPGGGGCQEFCGDDRPTYPIIVDNGMVYYDEQPTNLILALWTPLLGILYVYNRSFHSQAED